MSEWHGQDSGPRSNARLSNLGTPALVLDRAILGRNIVRMQEKARSIDVLLRPHVKTHKSPAIAQMQLRAGAVGLTVATLREAEAMLEGTDVQELCVAYPMASEANIDRVARLLTSDARVVFVIDGSFAASVIDRAGRRVGRRVEVLWEIDCGVGRCGTAPGAATVRSIDEAMDSRNLELVGLFTFPGHAYAATTVAGVSAAIDDESRAHVTTQEALGDSFEIASGGTTPTAWAMAAAGPITEVRPGNYVFHDTTQIALGAASVDDCALSVLTTVVSKSSPTRVVLDAGSKALAKDVMSTLTTGYGAVIGHPYARMTAIFEEHAILDSTEGELGLSVGDRVRVLPTHACAVANLFERYAIVEGDQVETMVEVAARGWGQWG